LVFKRCKFLLLQTALIGNAKFRTAFFPAGSQNFTAVSGLHAFTKTVDGPTAAAGRLIRTFHNILINFLDIKLLPYMINPKKGFLLKDCKGIFNFLNDQIFFTWQKSGHQERATSLLLSICH
jgi:hypothetical protein